MTQDRVGFIGGGNMARALIKGLLKQNFAPSHLYVSDPDANQRAQLASLGVTALVDNEQLVRSVSHVVLAVKPQVLQDVLKPIADVVRECNPLLLSIVAGATIDRIKALLEQQNLRIIRAMPNTPALVGHGATALYGAQLSEPDRHFAETLTGAVGLRLWVPTEQALESVTALSGSGPAYFLLLMEAMISAGEALGLSKDVASALTLQTAYGTARLALDAEEAPAELKANVTSKGGTTEAALAAFEAGDFTGLVRQALGAAQARALTLSRL